MRCGFLFCALLIFLGGCTTPIGNGWYVKVEAGKRPNEVLTWSYISQRPIDPRYVRELKDLDENYPVDSQANDSSSYFCIQQCIY